MILQQTKSQITLGLSIDKKDLKLANKTVFLDSRK